MAFDYAGLRDDTVQPLLAEFGKIEKGELEFDAAGTGEPWDSKLAAPQEVPATVVQTMFKKDNNMGTLVEKNDVLFLVSPEGVTLDPELAARIVVDETAYQVIRVDPLKPGSVTMLWKVHGRK